MSQEQLVGAYIEGQISRRTLIRRLVALGVSLGAATAYAHHLAPEAAAGATAPSEYPDVELRIRSSEIGEVLDDEGVKVKVTTADKCNLTLALEINKGGAFQPAGERNVKFGESGGKKKVKIGLDRKSLLMGRRSAEIRVRVLSRDNRFYPLVGEKTKILTK